MNVRAQQDHDADSPSLSTCLPHLRGHGLPPCAWCTELGVLSCLALFLAHIPLGHANSALNSLWARFLHLPDDIVWWVPPLLPLATPFTDGPPERAQLKSAVCRGPCLAARGSRTVLCTHLVWQFNMGPAVTSRPCA